MSSHSLTRTEPNSRPLLISPSFIFSGCTSFFLIFLITSQVNQSPSSSQKKKIYSHFIWLSLFPTDNYKLTIRRAYCIFSNNVISKSVFLVCCRNENKMKWLLVESVDSKCVSASNVGSWGWVTPSASAHPATWLRNSSSATVGHSRGWGEHHFMFNYSAGC